MDTRRTRQMMSSPPALAGIPRSGIASAFVVYRGGNPVSPTPSAAAVRGDRQRQRDLGAGRQVGLELLDEIGRPGRRDQQPLLVMSPEATTGTSTASTSSAVSE